LIASGGLDFGIKSGGTLAIAFKCLLS